MFALVLNFMNMNNGTAVVSWVDHHHHHIIIIWRFIMRLLHIAAIGAVQKSRLRYMSSKFYKISLVLNKIMLKMPWLCFFRGHSVVWWPVLIPELDVGPIILTRPNPTHKWSDSTRPDPNLTRNCGPDPTRHLARLLVVDYSSPWRTSYVTIRQKKCPNNHNGINK